MPKLTINRAPGPGLGRADIFVSVVAVLDSSTTDVSKFVEDLDGETSARYSNYELILVDNGIQPAELVGLREILAALPCIRVLRLSRRFTADSALFAGLESAIGDYVVILNPTYDPVETIAHVVNQLRDGGADIVQGMSSVPLGGTWRAMLGRRAFYWYNRRFLGVDIPLRATSLIGLTRRAVNTLTATSRSHRYLRHLIRHVGYRISDFTYLPRLGPTYRRAVKSGYSEAVEMISSYSTHPLRVVTLLGAFAALGNLLYVGYVVVIGLILGGAVQGWTTTSLQLSLMFFTIGLVLAVQSEYIGRILTETRREPSYVIMEELESETLIADLERRNVSN
jgi:hypothetical protein